jgi:allophanate hydrolase subunit 2
VLLADRQTTGGYPKIATVITADLGRLAQMAPGTSLQFESVTRAEAVAALRRQVDAVEAFRIGLGPARRGTPESAELLALNLIDGWVSARD